jgi:hypothetical protein
MGRKAKLTAEAVRKAIETGKPTSMTKLAHLLGHKGSVSGSLTRRLRALVPGIDGILKVGTVEAVTKVTTKTPRCKASDAAAKSVGKQAKGKWPHHEQSGYRPCSSYDTCFSILAGHKDGMPKAKLVELLAQATGKDLVRAGFDAQVVCSARGAAGEGLNPFEGPRNRSACHGYWVERNGDKVRLVLPAGAKGKP